MPNRCVAYGCSNTSSKSISVFHFPKNDALRKKWTEQVKRTRAEWKGPTRNSVFCSEHFTQDCFEVGKRMCKSFGLETTAKLKKDAVPTSFKRKLTEALEPAAKKPAYEKRERLRVNDSM
ncbi:PREDICTED: THAP domain-containing protein 10-like [Amphimedon queenslandica]|uniref:THAP-type domain-containing protein n=1 Tax=Amphimedon queenslandica TaxID=400682 RepID=A0AAN0K2X2_AMPQE|nr:PREDICTED: THAP domain-containing protein 10-like [Amphimedon queenslandica]|eukprot:XP_019863897.1 PREDICTED: THAP domain-containing protein 10-like [Amphimedon queenslandica]